jgi:hypothetical protein
VIIVATLDRINYRGWSSTATPSAVREDAEYLGKHRAGAKASLSLHRMFYTARHRVR